MARTGKDTYGFSGFQRELLSEIASYDRAPSGQEIRRGIENERGVDVNHGRLYPNLDELVDQDLVQKGSIDQRTNCYQLTQKGASVLKGRRDELNDLDIEPHIKEDTPADIADEWLGGDRGLEQLLTVVDDEETVLDVHQRLGVNSISRTRRVLQDFDLLDRSGDLLSGGELEERISELEQFVKERPVAVADGGEV